MFQKRILFLGGAYSQIPIIEEAKSRGWHVITCDYLPDNPGHKFADEYYNINTTDFDAVLNLAKDLKPDYVVAYATDPAAPVAAYVTEQLGLPGNPYQCIRILAQKDLFRNFLNENGFNSPKGVIISKGDNATKKVKSLLFPFIIKPTDSSGSKGVNRIDNKQQVANAVQYALGFSRKKQTIAEEFIDNEIADLHGDGFVVNGEMVFSCLGDHIYNSESNPYNPTGTLWPSRQPAALVKKINDDVARIIKICGFQNGAINIEARINSLGQIFIMEIGPRSGGHFVPQAIQYATGFNMVKAILDGLMGVKITVPNNSMKYSAYYALHSDKEGTLKELLINDELRPYIKEIHQYFYPGDKVRSFQGADAAIGILLLLFDTRGEMDHYLSNMKTYIKLTIS